MDIFLRLSATLTRSLGIWVTFANTYVLEFPTLICILAHVSMCEIMSVFTCVETCFPSEFPSSMYLQVQTSEISLVALLLLFLFLFEGNPIFVDFVSADCSRRRLR